jgi:LacI family transcriptional regulator
LRVSLRCVAERAGVSDATASRVLNGVDAPVARETRERVLRIAAEIGYTPNLAAKALATGRTKTVALWSVNLRAPHSSQVVYCMRDEIMKNDYDLTISDFKFRVDGALDTSRIISWPVDGVIAVDLPRGDVPGLSNSLLGGKPLVSIGAYVLENVDHVYVDFAPMSAAAVRHLHSVGCRRIAYLVPNWFEWFRSADDARLRGYETAIEQLGLEPEFIVTENEVRAAVGPVLKSHIALHGAPDALFCFNDNMTIAASRALREVGLIPGRDVKLVGCDGIDDSADFYPPLTTVVQPVEEMCAVAWTFLARRIKDPDIPVQQMTLTAKLEIRGSSTGDF